MEDFELEKEILFLNAWIDKVSDRVDSLEQKNSDLESVITTLIDKIHQMQDKIGEKK